MRYEELNYALYLKNYKMKKNSVEINTCYKSDKKLEKLRLNAKKKLEKQQSRIREKMLRDIENSKTNIIINYNKKLSSMQSKHNKVLQNKERKILWKKPLKKNIKIKSRAAYFNDLLTEIQLFAKLRDSDVLWYWECITCWKRVFYKKANWWHCISRKNRLTAYLEENINLQCVGCNKYLSWNYSEYYIKIDEKYWIWTYDRLSKLKWPLDVSVERIKEQITIYKQKNKQLLSTKNLECTQEM